jgi:DNA-binding MarR family transcriptional regulator
VKRRRVESVPPDSRVSPLDERVGFVIAELGKVANQRGEEILAPLGVTAKHLRVLEFAIAEPLSQQQLAARCGIDRTTMVAIVDDFERLGYAVRERHPADRRRYVVVPTDAGRTALRNGREAIVAGEAELLAELAPAEREQLRELAARVLRRTGPAGG